MDFFLRDFLESVEHLKKNLSFQAAQGEQWVLGLSACEDFQATIKPQVLIKPQALKKETTVKVSEIKKKSTFVFSPVISSELFPIVFVRFCPSASEQESGIPYSDEGAVLLDKIIAAMKWNPEKVYKTYLCPPAFDHFSEEHFRDCAEKLYAQITPFQPKVLIAWGERLSQILTGVKKNIDELHEKFIPHPQGFLLMPSWDPLYLIKRPEHKKTVWEDLKKIAQYL